MKRTAESGLGQKRRFDRLPVTSGLPQLTDIVRPRRHVGKVPIVLKKSFLAEQQKFLGPLMRFVRGDVRDHIDSPKIDHELA
jgi:hypothetical protein